MRAGPSLFRQEELFGDHLLSAAHTRQIDARGQFGGLETEAVAAYAQAIFRKVAHLVALQVVDVDLQVPRDRHLS